MADPIKREIGGIIYDKDGKDTGERLSTDNAFVRWLRQSGIGLAEGFAVTGPALYGLGGAVKDYINDVNPPTNVVDKILDNSGIGMITKGVRRIMQKDGKPFANYMLEGNDDAKVQELNNRVVADIKRRRPNATQEEITQEFEKIQKHSPKYFDQMTELMRPGLAAGRRLQRGITSLAGDERLPTERTQVDQGLNILGGAAVPIPGSTLAKIGGQVGLKVASNPLGKVALNAIELTTPITTPYSHARLAANVGVGLGIDQTERIANARPSVVRDAAAETALPIIKDDGSAEWKNIATYGAGAAAVALGAYKLRHINTPRGVGAGQQSAQDTIRENAPVAYTERLVNAVDELGAPTAHAKAAGVPDIERVRNNLELNSGSAQQQLADNWISHGLTPSGSRVTSVKSLIDRLQREHPDKQQTFQQVVADGNRLHGTKKAIQEASDEFNTEDAKLQKLIRSPTATNQQIVAQRAKVQELADDLRIRRADSDPNRRFSDKATSEADVQARYNAAIADPVIQNYLGELKALYKTNVDELLRTGMMDKKTGAKFKKEIDDGLTHFEENPLGGKGFLDRMKASAREKWNPTSNYVADGTSVFRGFTERKYRKGVDNPNEPRVNTPYDPLTQLAYHQTRIAQVIGANNAKRLWARSLDTGSKNTPVIGPNGLPTLTSGGRWGGEFKRFEGHTVDANIGEITTLLNKKTAPYYMSFYEDGNLIIYQVNSALVKRAFDFAPHAVVPIMDSLRKTIQSVNTGALRPQFMFVSTPWDAMTGAFFRNPNLVYGIISPLAARVFGRGSLMHRAISAVATPVDLLYVLARLPDLMVKRLFIEAAGEMVTAMGNDITKQLAQRSGFFHTLTTIPGGHTVLSTLGQSMAKAYHNSYVYAMKEMGTHHTNMIGQLGDLSKQVDRLSKHTMYDDAKGIWQGYKSILSTMQDSAKELFLSQNTKQFARELGMSKRAMRSRLKTLPPDILATLGNETRKIGGDFQRHSGYSWISRTLSVAPYGNVMVQSLAYVAKRFKDYPIDTGAKIMFGGVLPALWAYKQISDWPEAADYVFNRMPNDVRMQVIPLIRPDVWIRRMRGEKVEFTDDMIVPIRMAPEMTLIVNPVMHAMLALGIVDPGNVIKHNVVPLEMTRDLSAVLDQIFGISLPPINAIAAASGKSVRPGAAFRGSNVFQDIPKQRLQGANHNKLTPQSDLSKTFFDIIQATMGVPFSAMIASANVGHEAYKVHDSPMKGIKNALDSATVQQKAMMPMSNVLFPDVARKYIYTPINEELTKNIQILKELDGQWQAEQELRAGLGRGSPNRSDLVGTEPGALVAVQVDDPDLAAMIATVHMTLFAGGMKQLDAHRATLRGQHETLQKGYKATGTPLSRYQDAQKLALEINQIDKDRYGIYRDMWSNLVDQYGSTFQQKYRAPLSPQSLLQAVQASSQRATLAAQRRSVPVSQPTP